MKLNVYREFFGDYQQVGMLSNETGTTSFCYAPEYLSSQNAHAISRKLPLSDIPFGAGATAAFFDGIVPEGSLRGDIAKVAQIDRRNYLGVLSQVRNEPIGALLFSDEQGVSQLHMGYEELPFSKMRALALAPARGALEMTLESRISLAGAQSKVGLYHEGDNPNEGWFLPKGSAPSTHIVKTCSDAFPGETLCEALCMRAARGMDLTAEQCFLIDVGKENPLLAVERYDRFFDDADERRVNGLRVPRRRHQEDMCQASGISTALKYEPTEANYLSLMAAAIMEQSVDPLGDRFMLSYYQLFDYVMGNCDNHLKNWSILYSADWKAAELAPLYDVVNTTMYPRLAREMGVSFGGSRVIDEVTVDMVFSRLAGIGVSRIMAKGMLADMRDEVIPALKDAAQSLSEEGFPQVEDMLKGIMPGVERRLSVLI